MRAHDRAASADTDLAPARHPDEVAFAAVLRVLAGFDLRSLWHTISVRPFDYFLLFVCAFAIQFIGNLAGELLCFVGLFATIPWSLYTDGHFIGRTWAWNDSLDARA